MPPIAHDTLSGHEIIADWKWHLDNCYSGGDDFQSTGAGYRMLAPCAGEVAYLDAVVDGVSLNGIRIRHASGFSIGVLEMRKRRVKDRARVAVDDVVGEGGLVRGGIARCIHVHGYDRRSRRIRYADALARIAAWDEKDARSAAADLARIVERQKVAAAWSWLHAQPRWRKSAAPRGVTDGVRSRAYIRMVQQAWRDRGHLDISVTGVFGRKTRRAEDFLASLGSTLHA